MSASRSGITFDATTLRLARLRAGLTQEGLARRLDVTMRTVQHWEHGTGVPSAKNLLPLAELLGILTVDLWRLEDRAAA